MTNLILVLLDDIRKPAVAFSLHIFVRNKVLISQSITCFFAHVKLKISDMNDCHKRGTNIMPMEETPGLSVLTVYNMAEVQHCEVGATIAIQPFRDACWQTMEEHAVYI